MDKIFINRKDELNRLIFGLKRGHSFILVAPRRFGKTSLATKILEKIQEDKSYHILDIDIMCYSGGTVKSVAEGIIDKCLSLLGIFGKFRQLCRQASFSLTLKMRYNDLEFEPILHLFSKADPEDEWKLLEESLSLLEKIAVKEQKHLVVFFDEFGELSSLGERAIKVFRSIIQRHKHVSYLFAGSQETVMSEIFLDKSGAFYRFGELIQLTELTHEDVFNYICEHFPKIPIEVIDVLMRVLRGHPYYISLVIEHLAYRANFGESIANFELYIQNVLMAQEKSYIELQLLKIKEKSNALEIMRLISLGLNPYEEIVNIKEQQIYNVLKSLELGGYIRKLHRGIYSITDPLLEISLRD
ncbi:MAG: AAA family ATPase [Neisseriaceae bacterium]